VEVPSSLQFYFPDETSLRTPYTRTRVWCAMRATSVTRPDLRIVVMCLCFGVILGRWSAPCAHGGCARCESDVFNEFGDKNVYDSPDVSPAPPTPSPTGSFSFSDGRGTYERREFLSVDGKEKDVPYVNVVRSFAGTFRSGDIHACHQINLLAFGEAVVTTMEGSEGNRLVERTRTVTGGDRVVIPAHTPHLWRFTKDSLITESWLHAGNRTQCKFSAWFYLPLRDKVGDPKKTFVAV
jgi:hypothetical protein